MIVGTNYNSHLKSDGDKHYVTSAWVSYVKQVLSQTPRKFAYGLKIITTVKRCKLVNESNIFYYPISLNQFKVLEANLKGNQTYNYTTKN